MRSGGCAGCGVPSELPLRVRCVELHTYTAGGSLLNPGHRDSGPNPNPNQGHRDSGPNPNPNPGHRDSDPNPNPNPNPNLGHCDSGSALTISILLSEPSDFKGGEFVTWKDAGQVPVVHSTLARGDAVLFHSEKLHNVNVVEAGCRRSFVAELWEGATNITDRGR